MKPPLSCARASRYSTADICLQAPCLSIAPSVYPLCQGALEYLGGLIMTKRIRRHQVHPRSRYSCNHRCGKQKGRRVQSRWDRFRVNVAARSRAVRHGLAYMWVVFRLTIVWYWALLQTVWGWWRRELGTEVSCVLCVDIGINTSTALPVFLLPLPFVGWNACALSQIAILALAIVISERHTLARWHHRRHASLGRRILCAVTDGILWMAWWWRHIIKHRPPDM